MSKAIISAIIALTLSACGWPFGSQPWKKECDYKMPVDFTLVKNPEGKYAIRHIPTGGYLHYTDRYNEYGISRSTTGGMRDWNFKDSCEAKGFLHGKFILDSLNTYK